MTLKIIFEKDAKKFLSHCGDILSKSPAEHNLIFSICETAEAGKWPDAKFAMLFDDDQFIVAGIQSSPKHNLILSKSDGGDIDLLAETLAEKKWSFPGIIGPSDVAALFANKWAAITGQKFNEYMDQIIYALSRVMMPQPVEGKMRMAAANDKTQVADWMMKFAQESLPKAEQMTKDEALKGAEDRIARGRIAIWDVNGAPVAQAGVHGTNDVARISLVYTPADQRGKGYASAVVAGLTQKLLADGRRFCCLYADARNPVSNSIYRKIGYEFVGRSSLYVLGKNT